jgi:di/tricarboxylate transporter
LKFYHKIYFIFIEKKYIKKAIQNGFKSILMILPLATSLNLSFMMPNSSPSHVVVFSKGILTFKDMVNL